MQFWVNQRQQSDTLDVFGTIGRASARTWSVRVDQTTVDFEFPNGTIRFAHAVRVCARVDGLRRAGSTACRLGCPWLLGCSAAGVPYNLLAGTNPAAH